MAQVKFYLHKRGDSKINLPVILKYTFGYGKRFEYYTKLRANSSHYITRYYTKQSGKPFKDNAPNAEFLNSEVEKIRGYVYGIEEKAKAIGIELTVDYFRIELDKIMKPEKTSISFIELKPVTFMQALDEYIERCKNGVNEKTGHKLSPSIAIKYTTVKNMLKVFNKSRGKEIDFADFNGDLFNELVKYMVNVKNYSVNNYGRMIGFITTVLRYATMKDYNSNLKFQTTFKRTSEPSDSIYLTEEELDMLFKKDLSGNFRLERVRDLFLIGCWTGLRFSDFTTIKKEDVHGDRIRLKTQKTKQIVIIPIHPTVQVILEKYNYELPPPISNQKFNKYIQEIAMSAELNDPFTKFITKGGKTVALTMKKYEAVSSHVARRSFATNAYKRKIEPLLIMAITGHKTETEFLKYIKVTDEEKAAMFESAAKW